MALYESLFQKHEFVWLPSPQKASWGKFVVFYQPEEDASQVIAGRFENHKDLVASWNKPEGMLFGAGKFDQSGEISEWFSVGFDVQTPDGIKTPLQALFNANQALIAKRWSE